MPEIASLPWRPCRWPMQDTIVCPECKRRLVLPPGVRDITAQCPRCQTRFPSHPVAPNLEAPPSEEARAPESPPTPEPDPPRFDYSNPVPEGKSAGGGGKWGWGLVFFLFIGTRLLLNGGGCRSDSGRDQQIQRLLKDFGERKRNPDERDVRMEKLLANLRKSKLVLEAREFQPLFDDLCREFRGADGRRLVAHFDVERMSENIPLVKLLDPPARRDFIQRLNRSLPEVLEREAPALAWSSLEILTISRQADDEVAILTQLTNDGGKTRKVHWSLVRRLGEWRVHDIVDADRRTKLSVSAADDADR